MASNLQVDRRLEDDSMMTIISSLKEAQQMTKLLQKPALCLHNQVLKIIPPKKLMKFIDQDRYEVCCVGLGPSSSQTYIAVVYPDGTVYGDCGERMKSDEIYGLLVKLMRPAEELGGYRIDYNGTANKKEQFLA